MFLIYSNQHAAWWRADSNGYTHVIEEAGRYSRAEAEAIVKDATLDGKLNYPRTDFMTGREYVMFDEVMVPAPEVEA